MIFKFLYNKLFILPEGAKYAPVGPKSYGLALLLVLFLGPVGLFYASAIGGIVMIMATIIIGFITLGFGALFTWIFCFFWAFAAINKHNALYRKIQKQMEDQTQTTQIQETQSQESMEPTSTPVGT